MSVHADTEEHDHSWLWLGITAVLLGQMVIFIAMVTWRPQPWTPISSVRHDHSVNDSAGTVGSTWP